MHTIGEVAELGKVSSRLLRHYDEIGLLVPPGRSQAGYRLYSEHQDEAQERWGNTEAWKQSTERWSKYTRTDVERMKLEMIQAYGRLESVFASGAKPDSSEALTAVEAMRLMSDKWFYDTSKEMHVKGTEFVSRDERFVRNLDKRHPGLAAWIHQAAKANLAAG